MEERFPWLIIDKYFTDNPNYLVAHHLDSYNSFFNDGIKRIFKEKNPIKIMKEMGYTKMSDWAQMCYDRGDYYNTGYFSVMFTGSDPRDELYDDSQRIKDDMEKLIDGVVKSKVIPEEHKVVIPMVVYDFYFN